MEQITESTDFLTESHEMPRSGPEQVDPLDTDQKPPSAGQNSVDPPVESQNSTLNSASSGICAKLSELSADLNEVEVCCALGGVPLSGEPDVHPETEAPVCRVCHCEGDEAQPLFHPCNCSGSIRYVHQACLTNWLSFSKKTKCELCGETFGFQSVYSPDMPEKLSWIEIVSALYPAVLEHIKPLLPVFNHMLFVWIVIPLVTFLELKACIDFLFSNPLNEIWFFPGALLDVIFMWFLGLLVTIFISILSSNVSFVLLWLFKSREPAVRVRLRRRRFNMAHPAVPPRQELINDHAQAPPMQAEGIPDAGQGQVRETEPFDEIIAGETALRVVDTSASIEQIRDDGPPEPMAALDQESIAEMLMVPPAIEINVDESAIDAAVNETNIDPTPDALALHERQLDQGGAIAGPAVADANRAPNVDNPAANNVPTDGDQLDEEFHGDPLDDRAIIEHFLRRQREVFQNDQHAEVLLEIDPTIIFQFFTRLPEAMNPFGIRAPNNIFDWLFSSVVVLATHATVLAAIIVVPCLLGRFVHGNFNAGWAKHFLDMLSVMDETTVQRIIKNAVKDLENHVSDGLLSIDDLRSVEESVSAVASKLCVHAMHWLVGSSMLCSIGTLAAFAALVAMYCTGMIKAPLNPFSRVNYRRAQMAFTQLMIVSRVVGDFIGGMFVLPHFVGWMIDLLTLRSFGVTYNDRIHYCMKFPVTTSFLHTLIGYLFLSHLSTILLVLRELLSDQCANSLFLNAKYSYLMSDLGAGGADIIAAVRTWKDIARRLCMSIVFITPALLVMVFLPIRFGHVFVLSWTPIALHMEEIDYYVQIPLELIVFHVIIPFMFERVRYRAVIHGIIAFFLRNFCKILELDSIMLNARVLLPETHQEMFLDEDIPRHAMNPRLLGEQGNAIAEEELGVFEVPVLGAEQPVDDNDFKVNSGARSMEDVDALPTDSASSNSDIASNSHGNVETVVLADLVPLDGDHAQLFSGNEDGAMEADGIRDVPATPVIHPRDGSSSFSDTEPVPGEPSHSHTEYIMPEHDSTSSFSIGTRCLLLILLCSFVAFAMTSIAIYIPLLLGRGVMGRLHLEVQHDLYNYCTGYVSLWGAHVLLRYLMKDVTALRSFHVAVDVFSKYSMLLVKVVLLGLTWTFAVPVLVGVYCELAFFIPIHGISNETHKLSVLHCWAVGFVLTKIWIRWATLGDMGENNDWKRRFDRVFNDGLSRVDLPFILRELIAPAFISILDYLLVPYCVAVGIGRLSQLTLRPLSYAVQTLILRYSYISFLSLKCMMYIMTGLWQYLHKIYNDIIDSRYLVARQLTNRHI